MDFNQQLIFFFSALGAFNGLFLSAYFAFFLKNRSKATAFLAALVFVISVRVTKSVFLSFYAQTSSAFIQIGLTACFLIGPFLYLYVKESNQPSSKTNLKWLWHIVPFVVFMIVVGIFYPYRENWVMWRRTDFQPFGVLLFTTWLIYVVLSIIKIKHAYKKLFSKGLRLTNQEIWLLLVVTGNALIWLAYNTTQYTSYVVGAISFSFTLYLSIALWFFRKKKASLFPEEPIKYANKKIDSDQAHLISGGLKKLMEQNTMFKNPNLKLGDLSQELGISTHSLSQYLNDNLGKSFSSFINEYRVVAAAEMLKSNNLLTIEAIGNECGFKSNSTFYAAFKSVKGLTPAQYKKSVA